MMPNDDPATAAPLGASAAAVMAWRGGQARSAADWLAEEVPVALVFNGISHAVMMASPGDLEDFALGFALTEGLIRQPQDLYGVEVVAVPVSVPGAASAGSGIAGLELRLEVSARCMAALKERRRNLAGRTGCGLCGTDSLAQVLRPPEDWPELRPVQVQPAALARAQRALRSAQALQGLTGATHAAAWCRAADGELLLLREDIGRHNALDKLIGALHRSRPGDEPGFVVITSRASFEMVQKAALSGIALLAAVSAPTGLAVRLAQSAGLALAGFVRGDDFVAYTHPERFGLPATADAATDVAIADSPLLTSGSPPPAPHGH